MTTDKRRSPRRWSALIALFTLYVISAVEFSSFPWSIHFTWPLFDYLFFLGMLIAFPVTLLCVAWSFGSLVIRIIGSIVGLGSFAICLMICLMTMFSAIDIVLNGRDRSFDLIDEKRVNDSHIRLYLTDCGATCSFGLVLRKEFDTPFGLKIVKSLWKAPDTSGEDVKLQLPSDDEVDVLEQGTILARIRSNRGN